MKNILHARSRRHNIDGWALRPKRGSYPWCHTVCTTRAEARELRAQQFPELAKDLRVVKVSIHVTEVAEVCT